ncbi:MAG TPA: hypothetical protein VLD59_08155 [Steroidobacteraceae bacterium]|nr:hypothetical protein [Steroidobacteraceae bacterium]
MTARLYMFRGSEADNDQSPTIQLNAESGEPLSDDEREELVESTGWPTTRRYARTLHGTNAAFQRDPQYAHAFKSFDKALHWIDMRWPVWFALAALFGLAAAALGIWAGPQQ